MRLLRRFSRTEISKIVKYNRSKIEKRRYCSVTGDRYSDDHTYDIVISGGGMVGATMTACLAHENILKDKRILLLEGVPEKSYDSLPAAYNSRVVAISPATVELFQSFGAWKYITEMRYQEVKKMQVWDSCTDSLIAFSKENLIQNLAYIVENDLIMSAVMKSLKEMGENVEIKYKSRVKNYSLPEAGSQTGQPVGIELEDGNFLQTKLVIGADGYKSLLRQTAGIQTIQWDYNQMALVATLKLAEETENIVAWQRFLKTGPIAMLPLSPEYSCLIWTTTPEDAKTLLQLEEENFADAVNHAFWTEDSKDSLADSVLHTFEGILSSFGLGSRPHHQLPPTVIGIEENSRAMFPLGLCHATHYCKSRVAIIGDAAHRVHPLAGQGVNLGFGDVACLRDKIVDAVKNGADIGSLTYLLEYETERQKHVVPVMATIDGLNRLYRTSWTPIVLLRSLGLTATDAMGPIKEQFIKGATT